MPTSQPPIDAETAIDLAMALCAHRSSNERHAQFGKMIADEYLIKLPQHYKDDPVAFGYLTELMTAVASAVRAFSVQRDIFQSHWHSLAAMRTRLLEKSESYLAYSPLRKDSVWARVWAVVAALGGTAVISAVANALIDGLQLWVAVVLMIVLVPVSLLAMDGLLVRKALNLKAEVEESFPSDLEKTWEESALCRYPDILNVLLRCTIRIQQKWYPEYPTAMANLNPEELDKQLSSIVERHMAFRPNSQSRTG